MLLRAGGGGHGMTFFNRRLIGSFLRFSAAGAAENPSPKPHFMVEYLVSSCGLSSNEASRAAQRLSHLKSPKNPDSVVDLLRTHGVDKSQLRRLICSYPRILRYDAEKTLAPKLKALQDIGFSGPDLTKLILSHSHALSYRTLVPNIEFWRRFLGSDERLMRLISCNLRFLNTSPEKRIIPNLSLLRERGLPNSSISMVVQKNPWIITQRLESLAAAVDRVEQLGFPCSSGLFVWALWVLQFINEAKFKDKMQLMRSLGWSEPEFLSAFRKAPVFVCVSEETIRKKMDFFVNEAGCEPSVFALDPKLLMYSMEKRSVPRLHVMKVLKSSGLHCGKYNLITVMNYSDKAFMKKYVIPHEEKVPLLKEIYVSRGGAL